MHQIAVLKTAWVWLQYKERCFRSLTCQYIYLCIYIHIHAYISQYIHTHAIWKCKRTLSAVGSEMQGILHRWRHWFILSGATLRQSGLPLSAVQKQRQRRSSRRSILNFSCWSVSSLDLTQVEQILHNSIILKPYSLMYVNGCPLYKAQKWREYKVYT